MPAPSRELQASLLHAPAAPSDRRPDSRWAYPLWAILLASVFVLYHTSVLLVWNTPGKGLAKEFHSTFMTHTKGNEYFKGTRNTQSWSMFAPNPNRTNNFVQVFVLDHQGQTWDFEQDIWEKDRYPYVWYDRGGKVNRNIDGKKHYQRMYGAWVCREWERINGGEPAKSVTFVRRLTKVPQAEQIIANGGWDQWQAEVKATEQETITCKNVQQGTLPNELRERYGLPLIDEAKLFKPIKQQTWWDKAEAERRKAERDAELGLTPQPSDHDEPAAGDEDAPDQ